ncbi:MAG: non-heme iron oxygenase ferredoxin subunit [Actinobacteria bacterium]|jgi:3-phenylpropionate/trans-cinnamate dioxygenase ferredoxin subunit|nr:non-heme iron oxygenase ferredoxin subunit [Actinomycetota bacterium]MCL5444821.1 non-heme iron oxygenase ferredoxin subunit [Actinomycetota bacterium]
MVDRLILCKAEDIESGEVKSFEVNGLHIALVKIADEFYAVTDRCSHENYALSDGEVWEDEVEIECPRHGSTFDLRTGAPCSLPATEPIQTFEVEIVEDEVRVKLP